MNTADKDYFLDKNRKLTTDENKAAFVLIRKGQEISVEMAEEHGIGQKAETKKETPTANKTAEPSENKSKK